MRDAIISKNGTGKKADINVKGFDFMEKLEQLKILMEIIMHGLLVGLIIIMKNTL